MPRQGHQLTLDSVAAGTVTSGTFSPVLKTGIGLGFIAGAGEPAGSLAVIVRNRPLPVVPVKLPFYKTGSVSVVKKTS